MVMANAIVQPMCAFVVMDGQEMDVRYLIVLEIQIAIEKVLVLYLKRYFIMK